MRAVVTHNAIARLRTTGAKLSTKLRDEILALGTDASPSLIALLEDEESWNEKSPGKGWPPIHAVELLADLKAIEAIVPMLHAVVDTDWSDILHDRIIQRLPEFGPDVFEPVMALLGETADPESRRSLCVIAAKLGVRGPELFDILRAEFVEDETFGSMLFHDYGDPAALPDVLEAIEHFEPNFESLSVASDLTELVETYEHLGGVLPDRLRERNDGWFAKWQLRRDRLAGSLVHGAAPQRRAQKVGRNDPCPCGSGKKFKKCCIESRERSPMPNVITRDGDELVTSGDVSPE